MRRVTLMLLVMGAACSTDATVGTRRFHLTGVVTGHESSPGRIVIAHDAVEGLMPAMSMPFEISGPAPSMREGDRIAATLVVTGEKSWLEDVRLTARGGAAGTRVPGAKRATAGAVAPDLPLVAQNGRRITLGALTGRIVVLTFIYTRCRISVR